MYSDDPARILDLATALEKNGQGAAAIEKYRKVVELLPTSWKAHSSLATLLAESGNVEGAIRHFELAGKIQPDFLNFVNLFTLYLDLGKYEKATQLMPQILETSRQSNSPEEHERLEQELKRVEAQIRMQSTTRPF